VLLLAAIVLAFTTLGSPWGGLVVGVAAAVELAELWFWIWFSKRRRVAVGIETFVGTEARVVTPCHPYGQVRVQGELWRARCDSGADPDDEVHVVAVDGLTLVVER
jgi:membrane protein implicated in regulation of membrane protease activity